MYVVSSLRDFNVTTHISLPRRGYQYYIPPGFAFCKLLVLLLPRGCYQYRIPPGFDSLRVRGYRYDIALGFSFCSAIINLIQFTSGHKLPAFIKNRLKNRELSNKKTVRFYFGIVPDIVCINIFVQNLWHFLLNANLPFSEGGVREKDNQ